MSIINTPGKLSISRPQYSDGSKKICIRIVDEKSHAQFLELEVGYAEFAEALTGLANVDCDLEVRAIDVIGKTRENDTITFPLPEVCGYGDDRKRLAIYVAKDYTPEGWLPPTYFGSQDSFYYEDGITWARGTITRFV